MFMQSCASFTREFYVQGGKSYEILGQDFGTFACNSDGRCSFDDDLLRCNKTRCSQPGEPDSSTIESHKVSLQGVYSDHIAYNKDVRTDCAAVHWTSDTALSCTVAPGTGDLREVELKVGESENVFSQALNSRGLEDRSFKYAQPTMTGIVPNNNRAAGGNNVTIIGGNFGLWDSSPKARIGGTSCLNTFWISNTVIHCQSPKGIVSPPCK